MTAAASAQDDHRNLALITALFILYGLGFIQFYPSGAPAVVVFLACGLAGIPILSAAQLGLKPGLAAWFISFPLILMLLTWRGEPAFVVIFESGGFIPLLFLLVAVIPVGRLHDLRQRAEPESAERQKAQNILHDKEHFIEQVMEHIPDLVYIHDMDEKRNIYINRAVTSMLGYTPEAIAAMGSAVDEHLLHPDDLNRTREEIGRRLSSAQPGEVVEAEYRARHASGEWRWLASREVVFARHPDGRPRQILGTAQDITDRRGAQAMTLEKEKLRLALENEREMSQLRYQLMVTLSHEFRTPLSIILASDELLERYFDRLTPERRAECLATIKTQIVHLREMLDDITMVIGEGEAALSFNPSPIDLEHFCREMVHEFQASIGTAYTIEFQASGDLNPILADTELLRPVLKNLLSNGVKYSQRGSSVQCILTRQDQEVCLQIRDEGIGIPADDLDSVFETFYRASNALHIGGLGLGLRIVSDCVRLHGGTIQIESEEGKGTTVTVRLPANTAHTVNA